MEAATQMLGGELNDKIMQHVESLAQQQQNQGGLSSTSRNLNKKVVQVQKSSLKQLVTFFRVYKDQMNALLQALYNQSKTLVQEIEMQDESEEIKSRKVSQRRVTSEKKEDKQESSSSDSSSDSGDDKEASQTIIIKGKEKLIPKSGVVHKNETESESNHSGESEEDDDSQPQPAKRKRGRPKKNLDAPAVEPKLNPDGTEFKKIRRPRKPKAT